MNSIQTAGGAKGGAATRLNARPSYLKLNGPIEREAVALPLDHAFGYELADVGPATIEV